MVKLRPSLIPGMYLLLKWRNVRAAKRQLLKIVDEIGHEADINEGPSPQCLFVSFPSLFLSPSLSLLCLPSFLPSALFYSLSSFSFFCLHISVFVYLSFTHTHSLFST